LRAFAQSSAAHDYAGELSSPFHSAEYPVIIYPHGIVPDFDRGYVIHHDIEVYSSPDAAMVAMYDASGKRVREGHIWPPGAGRVRLRRTAATHEGAIIATGWAILADGSSPKFIAKTDLSGNTVKTIFTGAFAPEQICEAEDGTVWALGRDVPAQDPGGQTDVLRQFSFEEGSLRSYLPLESVEARLDSDAPWFSAFGSYVRCGKSKVAVYLKFTDEYVEIDTKSFEAKRWKLYLSSAGQGKASGLGITDDGHVYASFGGHGCRDGGLRGLFAIKTDPRESTVALLPVKGTLGSNPCGSSEHPSAPPHPGTFVRLWGTNGNALAIGLAGQHDYDIVWVNVISQEVASN
jgi:hypothetical protein